MKKSLTDYPRVKLTDSPTPLDYLSNLSQDLGPGIYLKRDDLTNLALGGDKPRKLEYELAYALDKGVDILVTCGSAQSNHARLTTAAARHLGLDCAVVLSRDEYLAFQGNLLTVYLMGAQVHLVDVVDHWDLEQHALSLCDSLKKEGLNPHYIPVSGTTPRSCLGYVRCGLEIVDQLAELDLQPDAFYLPFGTGGIFAGLMYALRQSRVDCPLIGISVNRDADSCQERLDKWWYELALLLDGEPQPSRGKFEIFDTFIGREYGDPTEDCLNAILLMAQSEGILLDPVYSGKVFSGLLAHCRQGRWSARQNLLMIHSGGIPALFAYHEPIREHLIRQGLHPKVE
jgi:D-cysteine desulfhydrase family pyridoxal phosphate-dependent enzyme